MIISIAETKEEAKQNAYRYAHLTNLFVAKVLRVGNR
jgi:hypothetical protein